MKLDNSVLWLYFQFCLFCFIKTEVLISACEIYFIATGDSDLEFENTAFEDSNFISSCSYHFSRNTFQIIT